MQLLDFSFIFSRELEGIWGSRSHPRVLPTWELRLGMGRVHPGSQSAFAERPLRRPRVRTRGGGGALAAGAVSAGVRVAGPRPGRSGDPRVPRPFGSRDAERKRADLASPRLDLLQDECFLLLLNFLTLRFFFFFCRSLLARLLIVEVKFCEFVSVGGCSFCGSLPLGRVILGLGPRGAAAQGRPVFGDTCAAARAKSSTGYS